MRSSFAYYMPLNKPYFWLPDHLNLSDWLKLSTIAILICKEV
jgi:hypothetical protein